ncbi:MAG: NfeD family protein [Planctomycetota bacterium]
MNWIWFSIQIDAPVAFALLCLSLVQAQFWARSRNVDTSLDLVTKLPQARFRYVLFFVSLFAGCWFIGVSIACLMVILWISGIVVAFLAGGDVGTRGGLHNFAAYLIREWAFGFPQMILHPHLQESTSAATQSASPLAGKTATVTSVLRPVGEVEIEGERYAARSESGRYIDEGEHVVVASRKGRSLLVTPSETPRES